MEVKITFKETNRHINERKKKSNKNPICCLYATTASRRTYICIPLEATEAKLKVQILFYIKT